MENQPHAVGTSLPDVLDRAILDCIPHRYPMLLVDRVVELEAYKRAVGIKNVSFNEPFFVGHFPGDPIVPGVLLVEAMAQSAAVLVIKSLGHEGVGSLVYFMAIDDARFRRPVRPGDQLRLEVTLQKQKLGVWRFAGKAHVGPDLAAEATFTAKIMPPARG